MNNESKIALITGGKGMLGSALSGSLDFKKVYAPQRAELDITDFKAVENFLDKGSPDIVIHTAAMTNVELCETEVKLAEKVNVTGTKNLVETFANKNPNGLFVYISSTGIYGTSKDSAYSENDLAQPTTVHHRTKFEGEKIVQSSIKNFLILRTGWLFGGTSEHPKNFVYKRYLEAKGKDSIYSDPSQSGNPTYVVDFAHQINELINTNKTGLYNCVGEGKATRLEYVQKILEFFEMPCKVKPNPGGGFKRVAPVSFNEAAINNKLKNQNICKMRPWEIALKEYVGQLKGDLNGNK